MAKDISMKDFRVRLAEIADRVSKGEVFRVIRRSKPVFFVVKITDDAPIETATELERAIRPEGDSHERALSLDEIEEENEDWETVVDFTDGGTKTGIATKEVLDILRKIDRS